MSENASGQILKATSIVGGSQAVTIVIRILRTIVVAMILGTEGIGILGLYDSVTGIVSTISGLGFPNSGVRQIAERAGSFDKSGIARTAIALKWTALTLGIAGMVSSILLREQLSELTFGNKDYAFAIACLSLTVLFASVASGYNALLQGLRHITDLAKVNIYGTLLGTIAGLPILMYWGKRGIVPFLIAMSIATLVFSWWFSRRVPITYSKLHWNDYKLEFKPILTLGIVFMSTNLMASGTTILYVYWCCEN